MREIYWLSSVYDKERCIGLLFNAVTSKLKHILQDEYDTNIQYAVNRRLIRDAMDSKRNETGLRDPNEVWRYESSPLAELHVDRAFAELLYKHTAKL